jgi:outer membrane receptor protein involved in Fe transport
VQNLTDARYNGSVVVNPFNARAFEPAPGRMGVVTVGYRF